MMIQCPCCHARFALEAALENGAARDLMWILAGRPHDLSRPLASYLGLWRSKTRALSWDRALRIAQDVLALDADEVLLAAALRETVEAIYAKREREPPRPLTSHNYLKRVLESLKGRAPETDQRSRTDLRPADPPPGEGPLHPDVSPRLSRLVHQAVRPPPTKGHDER